MIPGIDVSHHQGAIAWRTVATSPDVRFAILKATEGTSFLDPKFGANVTGCRENGIPWSAYHFARTNNDPTKEAQFFASMLDRYQPPDLPPVLDLEKTVLSRQGTSEWALDFLRAVHWRTGRRPIFYTYASFGLSSMAPLPQLAEYPLWIAHYTTNKPSPTIPPPWKEYAIWQYTSDGRISGIGGRVDRNFANTEWFNREVRKMTDLEFVLLVYSALGLKADRNGVKHWTNVLRTQTRQAVYELIAANDGNPNT